MMLHQNFKQINIKNFVAANFFKKESRSPRGFLPKPLLRAKNQSRQSEKSFPPEKQIFALPSPHFVPPHCPNTWRAEPRKKNTLSFFKRNFTPAKSEMQGVFFFRDCRGSARRWRNDSFSLKKSSSK